VSERKPADRADREALAELLVRLGVPEDKRQGEVFAHQFSGGKKLPEVRHWFWE
jgi:hypothetical protein